MIFLNYLYTIEVTHFSIFSIRFFFYWKKTKTYLVCNVPSSDNSNSLAQKYTCLHESLFFLLHCPSLHAAVADTTRYSKCTKNPHENFLSRVLLSVQQTKKAYPLHLMAKKIQRETSYDLLSFLVQKTVYFFWSIALKTSIHFSSFMSWSSFGYAS